MKFDYTSVSDSGPALGLIVLQVDETIEGDMRHMLPAHVRLFVSRVPSGDAVTTETLSAMAAHLAQAASLLPQAAGCASVGYACTSGAAEIGPDRVAGFVREGIAAPHVSDPLTALIAACQALGVTRLALLSPYVMDVSERLRDRLRKAGIETPAFGSFEEAQEARVVRIDAASIINAATSLAGLGGVDAIFLSCTNLRTMDVIDRIEAATGLPCLSSNQVLAWDMARGAGFAAVIPGKLGKI